MLKVKLSTRILVVFWIFIVFMVGIYFPEKWMHTNVIVKFVFDFVESILPGIKIMVNQSSYPSTLRVLLCVMWVTVPLQVTGYTYTEYHRMKLKNIMPPFMVLVLMFFIALATFLGFGLGGVAISLHKDVGSAGEMWNLLYTNLLGIFINATIVTIGFSFVLSLTIATFIIRIKYNHKEK